MGFRLLCREVPITPHPSSSLALFQSALGVMERCIFTNWLAPFGSWVSIRSRLLCREMLDYGEKLWKRLSVSIRSRLLCREMPQLNLNPDTTNFVSIRSRLLCREMHPSIILNPLFYCFNPLSAVMPRDACTREINGCQNCCFNPLSAVMPRDAYIVSMEGYIIMVSIRSRLLCREMP